MEEKIINAWCIVISSGSSTERRFILRGIPEWDDNKWIFTSPLVGQESDGAVLITRSGSHYTLGYPLNPKQNGTLSEMIEKHPDILLT